MVSTQIKDRRSKESHACKLEKKVEKEEGKSRDQP